MDPLSDLLSLLRPADYLTAAIEAGGDWAVRFQNQDGVIKCHAILKGDCLLTVAGQAPIRLTAGDCVLLTRGCSFVLASGPGVDPMAAERLLDRSRSGDTFTCNGGGDFRLIGTRFVLDGRRAHSLLGALPKVVHLRGGAEQEVLSWSIRQLMAETRSTRPGAALAARHLAQFILLQAFRQYLSQPAEGYLGILHALTDTKLARAIEAIHSDPARAWTLPDLAQRAGMSRSTFAQLFRGRVGEPPVAYLTRWRMLLAAERLETSPARLAEVARAVGYDSENAFSAAFKRVMGCAPGRFSREGR